MRGGATDVVDEGDFAEHVLGSVNLAAATVDHGDGKSAAVGEEHHDGYMEEAVDLTGDLGEFRARVGIAFQDDVEER